MMAIELTRKLSTAHQILVTRGIRGVANTLGETAARAAASVRRWWYRDHPWLGQFVLLRGGWVRLEGCRFDVSHPLISDRLRARLLRGRYERSELALIREWLDPASPVIEFGGGIGVVSTLVNKRLNDPRRHVVLEANPALIPVIEAQRQANGAAFRLVNAAIDYSDGATTRLYVGEDFIGGRVVAAGQGSVEVPATTFARLAQEYAWSAATLICDIEGREVELVRREGPELARHCAMVIVEVHPEFRTAAECESVFETLEAHGFSRVASVRKVHAFSRQRRGQHCSTV